MPACRDTLAALAASCGILLLCAVPARAAGWESQALTPAQIAARYGDPKDAIPPGDAGELMLRMVNAARGAAEVPPLAWSADAAELAQAHADEMAAEHYGAHYDLLGRDPATRWSAWGGADQVAENVVYYEIDAEVGLTPELLWSMVADWIESPTHFANLSEWHHTSLGFGVSIVVEDGRSYVAGVQEFLIDLGDYGLLPERAAPGAELELTGMLLPGRVELVGVALGSADPPVEQTPASLDRLGSPYPTPDSGAWVDPATISYDAGTGEFSARFDLPRDLHSRSAYVTVWARYEDDPGGAAPFCVMTQVIAVS
jgi:uncharacterized protein YkwD